MGIDVRRHDAVIAGERKLCAELVANLPKQTGAVAAAIAQQQKLQRRVSKVAGLVAQFRQVRRKSAARPWVKERCSPAGRPDARRSRTVSSSSGMVTIKDVELTTPFRYADMIPALISGCTPKSSALTINPDCISRISTESSCFQSCRVRTCSARAVHTLRRQINGNCLRIKGPTRLVTNRGSADQQRCTALLFCFCRPKPMLSARTPGRK